MEAGVVARLANDESFASELKARNDRAAAEAASRPKPTPAEPIRREVAVPVQTEGEPGDWDDGAPEWPDETGEAAMMADIESRAEPSAPKKKMRAPAETDTGADLPDLDSVVESIPAGVRKTLDELFRGQFTLVRRVPEAVLKNGATERDIVS